MSLPGLRPAFALLPQLSKLAPWQNTVLGILWFGGVEPGTGRLVLAPEDRNPRIHVGSSRLLRGAPDLDDEVAFLCFASEARRSREANPRHLPWIAEAPVDLLQPCLSERGHAI